MSAVQFAQPGWLWAPLALPLFVLLFFVAEKRRREALDQLLSARLQPRLAGSVSLARRRLGFALLLAGLALAFVALARPQWGFTWEERKQRGRDILVAIDTSRSMLANDLQPSRLARAKLAVQDLLAELEGDRVGLIAFAGSSFLQAPLTADFGAVRDSVQELDTEIIPRGGTNLSEAIRAAADAFGKGEGESRAVIIFSDGEELEADAVAAARESKDRFRIFTVGLGSAEGSLIPLSGAKGGTDFVRDEQGQYVKSRLDEGRLREVAEASGGFYLLLQNGPQDMRHIVRDGLGKMKEKENDAQFTRQPIERYHWPLTAAVAAFVGTLLLGERRRSTVARVAAVLLLGVMPAYSKHAGIEKFERKDFKGSLADFETEIKKRDLAELHFNAGAAAFELGDYAAAAAEFSKALGTAGPELTNRAAYNLANALARRGAKQEKKEDKLPDLKDAVKKYDEVLKVEPSNADATHNRDLVTKLIAELEKEEKKEDQKQDQQQQQQGGGGNDQQQQQNPSQGGKDDQQKQDKQSQQDQQQQQQQQRSSKQEGQSKEDQGKQDKSGKQEEKEQEKKSDSQTGERKPGEEKEGERPKPEPGEPDKKKSGELKSASSGQEQKDKEGEAAEAAEAAAAAVEGRMTEKDARKILEALRKFDQRVRLLDPRDEPVRSPNRPFKNW
jgi:Ca-activated chloride channel family protein